MKARALVEARVDGDRMILATLSALAADGDLLTDDEHADIGTLMAQVRTSLSNDDPVLIEAATHSLAEGTEAFAAMRMNRGIQKALSGKNIATV